MGSESHTSAYGHRRRTAQQSRRRSTKRTSSHGNRSDLLRGERLAPLSEVAGPQSAVTVGYVAAWVPLLGAPSMASPSAEAIDKSTLSFLLAFNLARVKEEQEEKELVAVLASKEQRLMVEMERFVRSWERTSRLSPVEAVAASWFHTKTAVLKREKRKTKKKRRKRTRRARFRSCSS